MSTPSFCRNCSFWLANDNMIGVGVCTNAHVVTKIYMQGGNYLMTAQNFGCSEFESWKADSNMVPLDIRITIASEFLDNLKTKL